MDVGMMLKVLSPNMDHAKKPDLCFQVLWIPLEPRRVDAADSTRQPCISLTLTSLPTA
jgi:hypothetical protein